MQNKKTVWQAAAIAALLVLHGTAVFASPCPDASSPVSDGATARWARMFLSGERQQVLRELERDLQEAHPNPEAASIWGLLHNENAPEAAKNASPPATRLGLVVKLNELRGRGAIEEFERTLAAYTGDPPATS